MTNQMQIENVRRRLEEQDNFIDQNAWRLPFCEVVCLNKKADKLRMELLRLTDPATFADMQSEMEVTNEDQAHFLDHH
jgi:hypothetical protein